MHSLVGVFGKQGHQFVAHILVDDAVVADDDGSDGVVIIVEHAHGGGGIHLACDPAIVADIGEQHGDLHALTAGGVRPLHDQRLLHIARGLASHQHHQPSEFLFLENKAVDDAGHGLYQPLIRLVEQALFLVDHHHGAEEKAGDEHGRDDHRIDLAVRQFMPHYGFMMQLGLADQIADQAIILLTHGSAAAQHLAAGQVTVLFRIIEGDESDLCLHRVENRGDHLIQRFALIRGLVADFVQLLDHPVLGGDAALFLQAQPLIDGVIHARFHQGDHHVVIVAKGAGRFVGQNKGTEHPCVLDDGHDQRTGQVLLRLLQGQDRPRGRGLLRDPAELLIGDQRPPTIVAAQHTLMQLAVVDGDADGLHVQQLRQLVQKVGQKLHHITLMISDLIDAQEQLEQRGRFGRFGDLVPFVVHHPGS
ncbi:MAG: hypothetical protein BWY83_02888 [bacterium ADurb.Bin478]|nr:MAG: hypothetical protein BWY83_02888 [bacterium ADurb.Bin478]